MYNDRSVPIFVEVTETLTPVHCSVAAAKTHHHWFGCVSLSWFWPILTNSLILSLALPPRAHLTQLPHHGTRENGKNISRKRVIHKPPPLTASIVCVWKLLPSIQARPAKRPGALWFRGWRRRLIANSGLERWCRRHDLASYQHHKTPASARSGKSSFELLPAATKCLQRSSSSKKIHEGMNDLQKNLRNIGGIRWYDNKTATKQHT